MSIKTPAQALNLDKNAQKAFINYYNTLSEKPKTTIRFFNRIEFYSVHGKDDTDLVANILHHMSNVKLMDPGDVEPLVYLSISKGLFERAIRELLLVKNYRVEVYTKEKTDTQSDWHLEYKGSPGNLIQFEDILFNKNEDVSGTSMISVLVRNEGKQRMVGLACVNGTDFNMSLTEFLDDDYFAELEATIVLLNPRECIIPSSDGEYEKVKTLMERNNIMMTVKKKSEFKIDEADIIEDLNKLLRFQKGQQESAHTLPAANKKVALLALGAIIRYMGLIQDDLNFGQFTVTLLNMKRFVHLDAAAVRALNLLPKSEINVNNPAYRRQSILGVLDRCRTPQGHRLMAQWVKQPLRDEAKINERHNIVECLLNNPSVLNDLHDVHLRRIPDTMLLVKRLMRKRANLKDLFRIYQVVARVPRIAALLSESDDISVTNVLVDLLNDTLGDLKMLKDMVEQVVDFEGVEKGDFYVKSSFDPDLAQMKSKLNKMQDKMDAMHKEAIEEVNVKNIKLEYVPHLGHHFRVTLKDEKAVRDLKKYNIMDVVKSGLRFVTDELKVCSVETCEIREEFEEQQRTIVNEVIRVAIGYLAPLTTLNYLLAQIDCLVSFAIAAKDAPVPYVRPKILPQGSGVLELKGVRHPCLELQENVSYIANDIRFKSGEILLYVITGPNMGGKSTLIRSVGVAVLMAHVGSFVPCDDAVISMVDSILGRIGASDDSTKGLSTFMVEMVETATIVRTATENSLVIIDELGRGTSTYDGLGLAWAIAEHLATQNRCFALFATHFHEIADLEKTLSVIKSCYMDAIIENDKLTLLYQLKPGVTTKSFGIHLAKEAGFPQDIIEIAKAHYEEYEDHTKMATTEEDQEIVRYVEAAVEKIIKDEKDLTDEEIEKLMEDCKTKVGNSNSEYFRKAFPELFSMQGIEEKS